MDINKAIAQIDRIIALDRMNQDFAKSYIDETIANIKKASKRLNAEYLLQYAVCAYVNSKYPDAIFYSDDSGFNKSKFDGYLRSLLRKDGFKIPDFRLEEPMGGYTALVLELKLMNKSPFLKDGKTLKSDPHLHAQYQSLMKLYKRGYYATFGVGFKATSTIIDNYMSGLLKRP